MRAISQRRSAPEGRDPGPTRGGSRSRDSLIVLAANLNLRVCLLRYLFVILFSSRSTCTGGDDFDLSSNGRRCCPNVGDKGLGKRIVGID